MPAGFFVGLIAGGVLGFVTGFLVGMSLKPEEEKQVKVRKSKAERIFNQALLQENQEKKLELLGKILDKYPNTIWADKALEEVIKMKKTGS